VPNLPSDCVFYLLEAAMRPNLRSNRGQTPKKLINANPAPAPAKKPKKQTKRKPQRRKVPVKAQTVAEEVIDAAEQLVAL
jgi:hypothetical protein